MRTRGWVQTGCRTGDHKGQYISNREMGVDIGRATTRAHPPHPYRPRPYYTANRPAKAVYSIVGAGEDVDVGMGPLWLPVRAPHHLSSPYLECIGLCGCPSMPPPPLFSLFGMYCPLWGPCLGDR